MSHRLPAFLMLLGLAFSSLGTSCSDPRELADMFLQLLAPNRTFKQGEHAVLQATVTNQGPDAASPTVTIVPSAAYDVVGLQSTAGTCQFLRFCNLGVLPNGASAQVEVAVRLRPGATDPTPVQAVVSGRYQDPDPSNDSATAQLLFDVPTLLGLKASPAQVLLPELERAQLSAVGYYDEGPPRDVTRDVTWTTLNGTLVVVDTSGVVTSQIGASGAGTTVQAQLGGISDDVQVDVDDQAAASLAVDCPDLDGKVSVGSSVPCTASQTSADAASGLVYTGAATHLVTWNCIGPAALCANAPRPGLVTCLQAGNVTVEATTPSGLRDLWPLECVHRQATGVDLSPPTARTTPGGTSSLGLVTTYADGTFDRRASGFGLIGSLLNGIPFMPSVGPAATLAFTGLELGGGASLPITDSVQFQGPDGSDSASSTVDEDGYGLQVTPRFVRVAQGEQAIVEAYFIERDRGSNRVVADRVSFSIGDPSIAGTGGVPLNLAPVRLDVRRTLVRGISPGTTTLTVQAMDGSTDSIAVEVVAAPLQGLTLEPTSGVSPVDIPRGGLRGLQVTAIYPNGTVDVTDVARVSSLNPLVASVGRPGPGSHFTSARLNAHGHEVGSTLVSASYGGLTANLTVSVVAEAPAQLFVSGPTPLKRGTTGQSFVGGFFSFGVIDLTNQVLFQSSDENVVVVGNGARDFGRMYAVGPGQADVIATQGNAIGSQRIFVHDGAPGTFNLFTPSSAFVNVGDEAFVSLNGTFVDGAQMPAQDLSLDAFFTSSDESVAVVGNGPGIGDVGRVQFLRPGGVIIRGFWTDENGQAHTAFTTFSVQ